MIRLHSFSHIRASIKASDFSEKDHNNLSFQRRTFNKPKCVIREHVGQSVNYPVVHSINICNTSGKIVSHKRSKLVLIFNLYQSYDKLMNGMYPFTGPHQLPPPTEGPSYYGPQPSPDGNPEIEPMYRISPFSNWNPFQNSG